MNQGPNDDAFLAGLLVIAAIMIIISLVIHIFFLLTLSRCLSRIQPRNRDMEPGLVWLNLIPCVSTIWIFFTVIRIASSLRKEYDDRDLHSSDESFGQNLGLGYAICVVLSAIPYVGTVIGIAALVCFIIYWVQIAGHSRRLAEEPIERSRDYDDEEYFDRGRRHRDDDDRERDADADTGYRE
jgi:hypothetical protein